MKNRNRNREAKEARRAGAAARAEYYATLTPQQKLDLLDARLGKGVGAEKQRAKLAKAIADGAKPATPEQAKTVFKEKKTKKNKK